MLSRRFNGSLYRRYLVIVKQVECLFHVVWKNLQSPQSAGRNVRILQTATMSLGSHILVILALVPHVSKYVKKKWLVDISVQNHVMIKLLSKFKIKKAKT